MVAEVSKKNNSKLWTCDCLFSQCEMVSWMFFKCQTAVGVGHNCNEPFFKRKKTAAQPEGLDVPL